MILILDIKTKSFLESVNVIEDFGNSIWNFLISHVIAMMFRNQKNRSHKTTK